MQHVGHAHPNALPGVVHAPAGMHLPAAGVVEAPRPGSGLRAALDVTGGVAFVVLVGIVCMKVAAHLLRDSTGWTPAIAWESVWFVAAILCAPLMPSGIRHDISWRSTGQGLALAWPHLLFATLVLGMFVQYLGELRLDAGPVALSLAVGAAEEFLFRVLLLGWLVGRLTVPAALTTSAVVFGCAHLHELSLLGLASVIPQTAGGFLLGAVYLRTRNPVPVILAHAWWDFPYFMALGGGISGGGVDGGMPTVLAIAPWLGFVVYGLWLVRDGIELPGRVAAVGCTCGRSACHVHPLDHVLR